MTRREFNTTIAGSAIAAAGAPLPALAGAVSSRRDDEPLFRISLAQWSLHRMLRAGDLDTLDFPRYASEEFGIEAVEYVNQFFHDKARDEAYLSDLKKRVEDAGSTSLLIMVDGEGALGHANAAERKRAVDNHHKWVEAAAFLGCHSIRVNAQSSGSYEDQMKRAADGLRTLCEFADGHGINVIVENHGGLSSHGRWLVDTIRAVDHARCGTLPDFGNFRIRGGDVPLRYDPYLGVFELMPFARAVSAKSHEFNDQGVETAIDYEKMLRIVIAAEYHGYVGIEYEGNRLSEPEGIHATKRLLERVHDVIAQGD